MRLLVFSALLVIGLNAAATVCRELPEAASTVEKVAPCGSFDSSEFSVNGVHIGMPRSQAVQRLGQPSRVNQGLNTDTTIGIGRWEDAYYQGLSVIFVLPKPEYVVSMPKELYVSSLKVRSPRWPLRSGLKVGDSLNELLAKYGPASYESEDRDGRILTYETRGFDGIFWVKLKLERIVELGIKEAWS